MNPSRRKPLAIATALFVIALTAGCVPSTMFELDPVDTTTPPAGSNNTRYAVQSTCPVRITYTTPSGTSQSTGRRVWTADMRFQSGDFAYVSAQLQCEIGVVSTTIYVWDGSRWVWAGANSAGGPYGIATTRGTY